jgi:transcriptional regulator with XRE-family HTH domain
MSAGTQKHAEARANVLMQEMPLYELRQARQLSQEQLACELHVGQANVSKIERRTDVYISTLRSYVEAMGGELEITAKFLHGAVKIKQFETIDKKAGKPRRKTGL